MYCIYCADVKVINLYYLLHLKLVSYVNIKYINN